MTIGSRPSTRRRYTPPRVGVILPLLHVAAREGHTAVADILIAARCNVDLAKEVFFYKEGGKNSK